MIDYNAIAELWKAFNILQRPTEANLYCASRWMICQRCGHWNVLDGGDELDFHYGKR